MVVSDESTTVEYSSIWFSEKLCRYFDIMISALPMMSALPSTSVLLPNIK